MAGFGFLGKFAKSLADKSGDLKSLGNRRKRAAGPTNVKKRRRGRKLGKLTGTVAPGKVKRRSAGSKSPKAHRFGKIGPGDIVN